MVCGKSSILIYFIVIVNIAVYISMLALWSIHMLMLALKLTLVELKPH